jgi:hypothetical protein
MIPKPLPLESLSFRRSYQASNQEASNHQASNRQASNRQASNRQDSNFNYTSRTSSSSPQLHLKTFSINSQPLQITFKWPQEAISVSSSSLDSPKQKERTRRNIGEPDKSGKSLYKPLQD